MNNDNVQAEARHKIDSRLQQRMHDSRPPAVNKPLTREELLNSSDIVQVAVLAQPKNPKPAPKQDMSRFCDHHLPDPENND